MAIKGNVKKILVRAPNWIGDAVMCLPALSALKALYPDSKVSVLTRTRAVPIFLNNPDVAEVIEYDAKGRHRGIKGRIRLSGEIKKKGFELAVLFQNAFDAAFISFISRIPERAGYSRDLRTQLLTVPVPVTDVIKKKHQVYYYLNIIDALREDGGGGGKVGGPLDKAPRIYLTADEEAWAGDFLEKNNLKDSDLVGVAPGASYGPAKRWPAEYFSELLGRLSGSHGAVSIIFGGPDDAVVCKEVSENTKAKHLNLAGSISLRHFMALLKRTRLFITNDSGPMHIASALGVPTVAVFGSTDPALTGPLGNAKVILNKQDCSPCFDRTCRFGHYECLKSVTPDEVYGAAEGLLKEGGEKWPA
jgi:heptosyltransferase-2